MNTFPSRIIVPNTFCHGGDHSTFSYATGANTNLEDGFTLKSVGPSSSTDIHTVKREDFNEIGRLATNLKLYLQSGGIARYNQSIGSSIGYPKGAVLYVDSGDTTYRLVSTISNNKNVPAVSNGVPSTGWNFANTPKITFPLSLVKSQTSSYEGAISSSATLTIPNNSFLYEIYLMVNYSYNPAKGTYGWTSGKVSMTLPNDKTYTLLSQAQATQTYVDLSCMVGFVPKNTKIKFDFAANELSGSISVPPQVSYRISYFEGI